MSQRKEKLAEYLFDEIGGIDDSIIASAMGSYPQSRRITIRRKAIVAVAALISLSVFTALFLGVLNRANQNPFEPSDKSDGIMNGASDEDIGDDTVADDQPEYSYPEATPTLAVRLNAIKDTSGAEKLYASEIKYFDGYARIVWKYSDEDYYRVCRISSSDLTKLQSKIENDQGKLVESAEKGSVEGIWISFGDGKVITPCLISSEGNVGYGSVFDYTAEVEPSEALASFICDIIGQN